MVNFDELPLFPLNTVLFPGVPLPLHIFEPRYIEMIAYCVEYNQPFGVVMIASGSETEASAVPCPVGTLARIATIDRLPENRLNVIVSGESRFKILQTHGTRNYLTALVSPMGEEDGDGDLDTMAMRVTDMFKAYLRSRITKGEQGLSAVILPQDPRLLSYAVADAIAIPLIKKQRLLELSSTASRLDAELDLLAAEIEARSRPAAPPTPKAGTITPACAAEFRKLISRN